MTDISTIIETLNNSLPRLVKPNNLSFRNSVESLVKRKLGESITVIPAAIDNRKDIFIEYNGVAYFWRTIGEQTAKR